jgi:hypothetical protein
MADLICPFSAPLAQEVCNCKHAVKVIRRGGEEVACNNEALHATCKAVQEHCRQASLADMGLEDDLLSVPHSTLVKTQFGTLLGLQQTMAGTDYAIDTQPDIPDLITAVITRFSTVREIPTDLTTRASNEYKLQRRRKK